ncbi:hypothetical protein FKP32DRAFT_29663 [Trametes sanguinea]|nr:hypothetical protein FKP32DRAFT_29663 [Trametes sanguinea]
MLSTPSMVLVYSFGPSASDSNPLTVLHVSEPGYCARSKLLAFSGGPGSLTLPSVVGDSAASLAGLSDLRTSVHPWWSYFAIGCPRTNAYIESCRVRCRPISAGRLVCRTRAQEHEGRTCPLQSFVALGCASIRRLNYRSSSIGESSNIVHLPHHPSGRTATSSTFMVHTLLVPVWPLNVRGALMCRVSCVRSQASPAMSDSIVFKSLSAIMHATATSKASDASYGCLDSRTGHSCSTHSRRLHRATLLTFIANLTELLRLAQFVSRANGAPSTLAMTTLGD